MSPPHSFDAVTRVSASPPTSICSVSLLQTPTIPSFCVPPQRRISMTGPVELMSCVLPDDIIIEILEHRLQVIPSFLFLDAFSHLYKRVCPFIRRSIRHTRVLRNRISELNLNNIATETWNYAIERQFRDK